MGKTDKSFNRRPSFSSHQDLMKRALTTKYLEKDEKETEKKKQEFDKEVVYEFVADRLMGIELNDTEDKKAGHQHSEACGKAKKITEATVIRQESTKKRPLSLQEKMKQAKYHEERFLYKLLGIDLTYDIFIPVQAFYPFIQIIMLLILTRIIFSLE